MKTNYTSALLLILFWSCNNVQDAGPSKRNTFIRTFEGPSSFTASAIEPTDDGYLILGTSEITRDGEQSEIGTILIRTNKEGVQVGQTSYIGSGQGRAIKSVSNSSFTGYIIVGDSIKFNLSAAEGGNREISSLHLIFVNPDLQPIRTLSVKDTTSSVIKTDFKGSSLTVTEDGRVIVLGTYEADNAPQKPMIIALKNDLTLDWHDQYSIFELDYVNARSIHYYNGKIIWASSILKESFNESYISIPYIQEPLSFVNYSVFGEDQESKAFFVNDITPHKVPSIGYGIIGTAGSSEGSSKDMLFARVGNNGSIVTKRNAAGDLEEDVLYIDADASSEDTGDALAATSDGGYILAGTTLDRETASRNILLVKVDALGEIEWTKILGGSGDEQVSTVVETDDKGFMVCGTNTIGGYSSIYLIKTNSKGELIN
jgi:hypothetical protein